MPSVYAHYRFGITLLPAFPADVRKTISRFRSLYEMGLHGPDIFYYSSPIIPTGGDFLGIKYHEQTGREFFSRVCRAVRMERSEASMAYLYGVLCHYCLDSVCHPVIARLVAEEKVSHSRLETELDRYLLNQDEKKPAYAQDFSPHIKVSDGESETISRFYPPATPGGVRRAVTSMAFYTKLLAAPDGMKRTILEKGIGVIPKEIQGMMMTTIPNAKCAELCGELMECYRQAEQRLPVYLEQLREHMTYSAQFGEEFALPFG